MNKINLIIQQIKKQLINILYKSYRFIFIVFAIINCNFDLVIFNTKNRQFLFIINFDIIFVTIINKLYTYKKKLKIYKFNFFYLPLIINRN